jgi:catechol 2,3-dioxygenase-like lactoylglutathione lyase family enzyme
VALRLKALDHFCLTVAYQTVDELVAALCEAGIPLARGPTPRRDGAAVFVSDPDGISVELQLKNVG